MPHRLQFSIVTVFLIQIQKIKSSSFPSGLSFLILHIINIIRMANVSMYGFRSPSFLNRHEGNKHNEQLLRTFVQLRENSVHLLQSKFVVEYRTFFLISKSHSFCLQISFFRCPPFPISFPPSILTQKN